MNEAVVKTVNDWNEFISSLVTARDRWDGLQRFLDENPIHGDDLPPKIQKLLSMHRRMQFTNAIGDLSDHWRAYGGLDSFFVEVPEDEELRKRYNSIMERIGGNGDER